MDATSFSDMHFASVVEGNIGATLGAPWLSGRDRREEEEEAVQYSEDPFSTGLVGVGTTDGLRVVNRVSTMV